jgi:hypothetical protein
VQKAGLGFLAYLKKNNITGRECQRPENQPGYKKPAAAANSSAATTTTTTTTAAASGTNAV